MVVPPDSVITPREFHMFLDCLARVAFDEIGKPICFLRGCFGSSRGLKRHVQSLVSAIR